MKEKILDFFKGIAIGISNVIPGFSGGTMAVILKVYDKLIGAISNLFKTPIKVIKDVWTLAIGIIVGIAGAVLGVVKLLELFPIPVTFFFVGLIIGSIPSIFKNASKEKLKIRDIITAIVCASIIIILPFISSSKTVTTEVNAGIVILMIVLGAISAGAMIIPGISGSLVLMAFGYYTYLMGHLDFFVDVIKTGSFSGSSGSILVCLGFGLGAVIGLVFVSKILELLLKKHTQTVYYGILGLLIASPFSIIYSTLVLEEGYKDSVASSTWISWVIGLLLMAISAFLAGYMSLLDKKHKKNKEIKEGEEDVPEIDN